LKTLAPGPFQLAENPRWHPLRETVWWTDIPDGTLWECGLDGSPAVCRYRGEQVGGFSIEADGALALFRVNDIVRFDPATAECSGSIRFADPGSLRFNDVLAGTIGTDDERGGAWIVRAGEAPANLWRGTRISNGMAVAPDGKSLYWTDSTNRRIVRFLIAENGIDSMSGTALIEFAEDRGTCPDGLALDACGNLWSAQWDGGLIAVFHPGGGLIRKISLPAGCPTALCFLPSGRGPAVTFSLKGKNSSGRSPVVVLCADESGAPVFLSRLYCAASTPEIGIG